MNVYDQKEEILTNRLMNCLLKFVECKLFD